MRYLLFLFTLPLLAQPANLVVQGVTSQQAIIAYTSPDANACTLSTVDNSGHNVIVFDTNGTYFPGANVDLSRPSTSTWNNGLVRQIVVGHRASAVDPSGNVDSLSLQNNASITETITCTGGSASITFSMRPQPAGRTDPQPTGYLSGPFGNLPWPTNVLTAPGTQLSYIDPLTGQLLLNGPQLGDVAMVSKQIQFASEYTTGAWTNAFFITATPGGTQASSANTDPIFVGFPSIQLNPNNAATTSSNFVGNTVIGVRVCAVGNGTDATAANRVVNLKLSADTGQTSYSATGTVTLPQTTSATVCYPATNITTPGFFADWNLTTSPPHDLMVPGTYTVSTSGTTVTGTGSIGAGTMGTGFFPKDYPTNARVIIAGTQYPVSTVANNSQITLGSTAGTQASATMTAFNSGVTIAKATATGTVSLNVYFDWLYTNAASFYAGTDGATVQCSPLTSNFTVDAGGSTVPSYAASLCLLTYSGFANGLYLLRRDTGAFWQVGTLFNLFGNGFANDFNILLGQNPWDSSDAMTFYGISEDLTTDNRIIAKYNYAGTGQGYTTGALPDSGVYNPVPNGQSQTGTSCASGWQLAGNICSFPVSGVLSTQLNVLSANATKGAFGVQPQAIGVMGTTYVSMFQTVQDTVAAFLYDDLSTGLATGFKDTMFSESGYRFGCLHTPEGFMDTTHHLLANNPCGSRGNAAPFGGPYSSPVLDVCTASCNTGSPTWSSNTAVSPSLFYTCNAPTCGSGNVNNAILYRITGNPCSSHANATEYTNFACTHGSNLGMLAAAQVGDLLGDLANNSGGSGELQQILTAPAVNTSTDLQFWALRNYNGSGFDTHLNGWAVTEFPTPITNVSTSQYSWYNTTGSAPFAENTPQISHFDAAPITSSGTYVIDSFMNYKNGPANSAGAAAAAQASQAFGVWNALIAGTNWPGNGIVDYYPSARGNPFLPWTEVFPAYQGGTFLTGGYGTAGQAITVTSSAGIYKLTNGLTTNYKQVQMEANAGYFQLKDVSGPNCSITTGTPYTFGVVLVANECTSGSAPGDIWFYVPGLISASNCYTNQLEVTVVCIVPASPIGNWAEMHDGSNGYGNGMTRLTKGLCPTSGYFTATNWRSEPNGTWGFIGCPYEDGVAPNMWLAKMPPSVGYDSTRRDYFQPIAIQIGARAAQAEVRFGYEENGLPSDLNCTPRGDSCLSISGNLGTSFNFLSVDGHSGTTCTNGCVITIPGLSGRVLWRRIYTSPDGTTWNAYDNPQPVTVP